MSLESADGLNEGQFIQSYIKMLNMDTGTETLMETKNVYIFDMLSNSI
jgi:hypothetical protein